MEIFEATLVSSKIYPNFKNVQKRNNNQFFKVKKRRKKGNVK